jgi:cell division septation protein DedD
MAQDDYYYEIQLTNKQLVFYFMAGATGLILSFLAGVMVGKGVDSGGGEVLAARPVQEERVVAEETPAKAAAPPAARDLTYAQRLEAEKTDDTLDRTKTGTAGSGPPAGPKPSPAKAVAKSVPAPAPAQAVAPPVAGAPPRAEPKATVPKPAPEASPAAKAAPTVKGPAFTIQVVALKDKVTAESVVAHLKDKGFYAYVVSPEGDSAGLFSVRVGTFATRSDAERTEVKLRDQEKFKPFIVKQQ